MRINRAVLLTAMVALASLAATLALLEISADWDQSSPIAGDIVAYEAIATDLLSGGVPYIDSTVEHLPVLLVPIVAIGIAAEVSGVGFEGLWPIATVLALIAAVLVAGAIHVVPRYQMRFAVAAAPMVPLIIYRLEVYVVLLALGAILAFSVGRMRAGTWTAVAGALAKGWPIVLLAVPFRRGAVRLAAMASGTTVVLLALVASLPGFQEGRSFTGIHSETIVGNLLLLARHVTGDELGLVGAAGATYVEAPAVAVALNAAVGLVVGVTALVMALRTSRLVDLLRICGLATLAIILLSPLFSAQFVFWLAPFVPLLTLASRRLAFVAGALSTLLVAMWNPQEAWWAIEVALRNGIVLALAVRWMIEVRRTTTSADAALASEHVS